MDCGSRRIPPARNDESVHVGCVWLLSSGIVEDKESENHGVISQFESVRSC